MPYPPITGANTFGLGPSAGSITAFLRQPVRAPLTPANQLVIQTGAPGVEGLDSIRLEWTYLTQDQFAQLQKAVEEARATYAGFYYLRYWDRRAGSPAGAGAFVVKKCIPMDPVGVERGQLYRDVSMEFRALGIA